MAKNSTDNFQILKGIGKTFKMLSLCIRGEMERRGIEISREQGMLLRRLGVEDGLIQNELAWVTDRDKTSLARLLTKMEKKGWIKRKIDKNDKRAKRVFLTVKGRRKAIEVQNVLNDLSIKFFQGFQPKEKESTIQLLEKIQHNLDTEIEI